MNDPQMSSRAGLLHGLAALTLILASNYAQGTEGAVDDGRKLAFDRGKGNCLACHLVDGGESPGNIGPPLIAMKMRFPDFEKLKAQIADATQRNPESPMPPFARNRILTAEEIEQIATFVWTL